jgi:hypothetical protein
LISAIILPILLFAVTVSLLLDRQDRSSIEHQLETVARTASAAVNLKLASEIATLETIAVAIDLPEGVDDPALREARRVIEAERDWLGLRLNHSLSGRTVVHLGHGLGDEPGVELGKSKVAAGGARGVGRVRWPRTDDVPPYLPIQIPIIREGRPSYLLTAFVRAAVFGEVLDVQSPRPVWIVGILDAQDNLVSRSGGTVHDDEFGPTTAKLVA